MDPNGWQLRPYAIEDDGVVFTQLEAACDSNRVTFDGYTYDLVAIGDQCWFAENLRSEHYANGDAIPGELSDGEWSSTTTGVTVLERVHRLLAEVTMKFQPC